MDRVEEGSSSGFGGWWQSPKMWQCGSCIQKAAGVARSRDPGHGGYGVSVLRRIKSPETKGCVCRCCRLPTGERLSRDELSWLPLSFAGSLGQTVICSLGEWCRSLRGGLCSGTVQWEDSQDEELFPSSSCSLAVAVSNLLQSLLLWQMTQIRELWEACVDGKTISN